MISIRYDHKKITITSVIIVFIIILFSNVVISQSKTEDEIKAAVSNLINSTEI